MRTGIFKYSDGIWQRSETTAINSTSNIQLALCFASKKMCLQPQLYDIIRQKFPEAQVAICSTSGEIYNDIVIDDSMLVTAFQFSNTCIHTSSISLADYKDSYQAATALMNGLSKENLTYVMVLSDGSLVNGSELVKGLNDTVPASVQIPGGLAGDGADFTSTMVGLNGQPEQGKVIAIRFYGSLVVSHSSHGGWETYGPERIVTKAKGNELYQLDDKEALQLYKKYLGDSADELPGSALRFPLSVLVPGAERPITRTIVSINHESNTMTFAGDVPEGSKIRFIQANHNKLTAAASTAAEQIISKHKELPSYSLLVSCIGCKLVLGQRVDEEVEAVLETFGASSPLSGFYFYGEISPFHNESECHLHNQTITITSFYELA